MAFDPEGSYDDEDGGAGGPETKIQFIILLAAAIAVAILISIGLGVYGGAMGDMGNDEPGPEDLDIDTNALVLDTSDLGPQYRQTEETITNTSNETDEQRQLLTNHGILRTHSRIFTLDTNDTSLARNHPSFITSTATVYRDAEAAKQDLKRELDRLKQRGATVTETTLQTGTNATAATYETDTGMRAATLYYHSREHVICSVTTTDPDTHFENRAAELLLKMGTNPT